MLYSYTLAGGLLTASPAEFRRNVAEEMSRIEATTFTDRVSTCYQYPVRSSMFEGWGVAFCCRQYRYQLVRDNAPSLPEAKRVADRLTHHYLIRGGKAVVGAMLGGYFYPVTARKGMGSTLHPRPGPWSPENLQELPELSLYLELLALIGTTSGPEVKWAKQELEELERHPISTIPSCL